MLRLMLTMAREVFADRIIGGNRQQMQAVLGESYGLAAGWLWRS